jgi:methionyl-tRNA formyltransferase
VKLAFLGSPDFAVPSLEALLPGHEVVLVVTQPDQPKGRGRALAPPAVKEAALRHGLEVMQPRSARSGELEAALRERGVELAVVVAYGKILPRAVLDAPARGCINVHGSLLPKYRGAAPIQWAVIEGEAETGVTIMQLDEGMDTGPMLARRSTPIGDEDTAGSLFARLAPLGAALLVETIARLDAITPEPQDPGLATHAPMLDKGDGRVDWSKPARVVRDRIRGLDPWPGAFTELAASGAPAEPLKLYRARLADGGGPPGTVLGSGPAGLVVACGDGAVALGELQLPGKKRLEARAFLAGRPLVPGTHFV